MPTFREMLFRLGASYDAGDWFGLRDEDTGWWSDKRNRPYVLIDRYAGIGPAKVYGRTATGKGEIPHRAHLPHEAGCILTKDGRIRTYVLTVDGGLLPDNYSCREPDQQVVQRILAAGKKK